MSSFALNQDAIKAWCVRQNLNYLVQEQARMVLIPRGANELPLRLIDRPERGMMTWGVVLPFLVPADRRSEVGAALNLLNSNSFMGAWTLNTQTGEVYFRVTVPTTGVTYTDEAMMFLARVLSGTVDPVAGALSRIATEGQPASLVLAAARP